MKRPFRFFVGWLLLDWDAFDKARVLARSGPGSMMSEGLLGMTDKIAATAGKWQTLRVKSAVVFVQLAGSVIGFATS